MWYIGIVKYMCGGGYLLFSGNIDSLSLSRSPQSCSFSQSVPLLVMTHKRPREYLTCMVVMMMETRGGGLCTLGYILFNLFSNHFKPTKMTPNNSRKYF